MSLYAERASPSTVQWRVESNWPRMERTSDTPPMRVPGRTPFRTYSQSPGHPRDTHFMKHPIAALAEPTMKFFTPELFRQVNSPDDREADIANESWESAITDYQQQLEALRGRMPSYASGVIDLCLHDATTIAYQEIPLLVPGDPLLEELALPALATALVILQRQGKVWTLAYRLNGLVRQSSQPEGWVSSSPHQWLYDEVDEDSNSAKDAFLHRILFSDGRVLEIPFRSVKVTESALADSFVVPKPVRSA